MLKYHSEIRENFEKRFEYAQEEFYRHCASDYSKPICEKMLFLYEKDKLVFSSFFQKIMGWDSFECIEGLEGFNSFIGNFFDDAYCKISYDNALIDLKNDINKRTCEALEQEYKPVNPQEDISTWVIEWCTDQDDYIGKNDLSNIIDRLILLAEKIEETHKQNEKYYPEIYGEQE